MELKKVLVIEDDPEICNLLEIHLKDLGCQVDCVQNGIEGKERISGEQDLIILDLMLPGMDGVEICQKTRAEGINTPIMMLTARSEEIDRVLGLEMGADDYMVKPFSVREFIARVKAIFRRTKILEEQFSDAQNQGVLKFDELTIDIEKRKILLSDKRVDLSPKEFELLVLMASNPGKSYKRSNLLSLIWGYDFEGYEHTVNSHINRLRAKIEPDMDNPKFILTSWGVGYSFNEDLSQS